MISILDQSTESCLVVRFSGKLSVTDYQQFIASVQARLSAGEPANLVIELTSFKFYDDLETAKMDLKFGFGEYSKIQKAAIVGDQKWIDWFVRLAGPFTHAKEKHFPAGQLEEAILWASGQGND